MNSVNYNSERFYEDISELEIANGLVELPLGSTQVSNFVAWANKFVKIFVLLITYISP